MCMNKNRLHLPNHVLMLRALDELGGKMRTDDLMHLGATPKILAQTPHAA
jgi:hypothetical protein